MFINYTLLNYLLMLIVTSQKKYASYILKISCIIIVGLAIIAVFKNISFSVVLVFLIALELIILHGKFTSKIIIDNEKIKIEYHQWLNAFVKEVYIKDVTVEKRFEGSMRRPMHAVLDLFHKKRLFFSIDVNDGFTEEDFKKVIELVKSFQDIG